MALLTEKSNSCGFEEETHNIYLWIHKKNSEENLKFFNIDAEEIQKALEGSQAVPAWRKANILADRSG